MISQGTIQLLVSQLGKSRSGNNNCNNEAISGMQTSCNKSSSNKEAGSKRKGTINVLNARTGYQDRGLWIQDIGQTDRQTAGPRDKVQLVKRHSCCSIRNGNVPKNKSQ